MNAGGKGEGTLNPLLLLSSPPSDPNTVPGSGAHTHRRSRFTRLPFASTSLGAEQPLLNSELLGYGRDPLAPIKDEVTADGDMVVLLDAEPKQLWR